MTVREFESRAGRLEDRIPSGKSDNDRSNVDRAKRSVDDSCDLEHLLCRIGNVGRTLKLDPKRYEICAVWLIAHSVASPNTSRPRRGRPGLTIGPSVAGASASTISV